MDTEHNRLIDEPVWETRIVPVHWETDIKTRKCILVRMKGVTQWYSRGDYINPEATFRNLNNIKGGQRT